MTVAEAGEIVAANYVKISSAAETLGIDAQQAYRWFSRGRLRGIVVDGTKLVETSSIEQCMAARTPVTA